MVSRAPFIVIEGLDRSGKTTQTSILHDLIQATGRPVKLLKFPDRTTPVGIMIDSYLRSQSNLDDRSIHLLFSANRWEFATQIEQLLTEGTTILCDRYAFSGIAFSASKGLPYEWCRSPDISLPAPDLTLFLDISSEKAMTRGRYGEERYENEDMQNRVREVFRRLGTEMTEEKWVEVDAGLEKSQVTESLWKHIKPLVDGVDGPIQRLWEDMIQR